MKKIIISEQQLNSLILENLNDQNEIYYLYNHTQEGGGYISARDAGRPPAAKGIEIDSTDYYVLPEWINKLDKSMKTDINKNINWEEIDDEDEDHYNKVQYIRKQNTLNSVKLIPVLTQQKINGIKTTKQPPRGYYSNQILEFAKNDPNAQKQFVDNNNLQTKISQEKKNIQSIADKIKTFVPYFRETNISRSQKDPNTYDVDYVSSQARINKTFTGSENELIDFVKNEYQKAVKLNDEYEEKQKQREKERTGDNVVELSNGKLIPMIKNTVTIPSWAAPHLIGRGGDKIKDFQKFVGHKVNIQTYDENEPRKAWAKWIKNK